MNGILKKGIYLTCFILIVACGTKRDVIDTGVNTRVNSKYRKSTENYSGKLSKTEYNNLIKKLEKELKTRFPDNKSILINYNQKAPNCLMAKSSKADKIGVTKNRIRISSRMSSNHNAIDFFVYTKDSYAKEIYAQMDEFIVDSGFFYETIFTEHQNCAGFLIIKPNGKFYKHYGEDYYSRVRAYLEKK